MTSEENNKQSTTFGKIEIYVVTIYLLMFITFMGLIIFQAIKDNRINAVQDANQQITTIKIINK